MGVFSCCGFLFFVVVESVSVWWGLVALCGSQFSGGCLFHVWLRGWPDGERWVKVGVLRHYCPGCGHVHCHTPKGHGRKGLSNRFYCRFCGEEMLTKKEMRARRR